MPTHAPRRSLYRTMFAVVTGFLLLASWACEPPTATGMAAAGGGKLACEQTDVIDLKEAGIELRKWEFRGRDIQSVRFTLNAYADGTKMRLAASTLEPQDAGCEGAMYLLLQRGVRFGKPDTLVATLETRIEGNSSSVMVDEAHALAIPGDTMVGSQSSGNRLAGGERQALFCRAYTNESAGNVTLPRNLAEYEAFSGKGRLILTLTVELTPKAQ